MAVAVSSRTMVPSQWLAEPPSEIVTSRLWLRPVDVDAGVEVRFGVCRGGDSRLIGSVGLAWRPGFAGLELVYRLAEEAMGQGFALEAVSAVMERVWRATSATGLVVSCGRDDQRSARLARRLGFSSAEGTDHLLRFEISRDVGMVWSAVRRTLAFVTPGGACVTDGIVRVVLPEAVVDVTVVELKGDRNVHLQIVADIGAETSFPAQHLLRHNASLAVGALCLDDGRVVLRHVCAAPALEERTFRLLIHEAARLRARATRPRPAPRDIFTQYAEL